MFQTELFHHPHIPHIIFSFTPDILLLRWTCPSYQALVLDLSVLQSSGTLDWSTLLSSCTGLVYTTELLDWTGPS